jgi:hypothetical protein
MVFDFIINIIAKFKAKKVIKSDNLLMCEYVEMLNYRTFNLSVGMKVYITNKKIAGTIKERCKTIDYFIVEDDNKQIGKYNLCVLEPYSDYRKRIINDIMSDY